MLDDTILWTFVLAWVSCYGLDFCMTILNSWRYCKFPKAGVNSTFATQFVHNLYFAISPVRMVTEGYEKFKGQAYRFLRNDGNVIVLPHTLLGELSTLPPTIANPHEAISRDFLGPYSGIDKMTKTGLHRSGVRQYLSPSRLDVLIAGLEQELNDIIETNLPQCTEWTEFSPFQVFEKLSARLSGRVLVGSEICRDPSWMDLAINYPKNVMTTVIILRFFPYWTHPLLCYLVPPYWWCRRYITKAKNLLRPYFHTMLWNINTGKESAKTTNEVSSILEWLANTAPDQTAEELTDTLMLLTFASIHTVVLRMVNVLYDLVANPHLWSELQDEVESVLFQHHVWEPSCYEHLHKLDSVIRESQRITPASTLGMKRLFLESHTFSNGLHIPRGTYVCLPVYAIENDPDITSDPEVFDGLRAFRSRQQTSDSDGSVTRNHESHEFSSPNRNMLSFGYGKFACPGRFYASLAIKMLFVKLTSEYEFDFLKGKKRPEVIELHEAICCWPWQRMRIRRKENATSPF